MNVRAVAVALATGAVACLSAAVIAASPAQAPTLDDCPSMCPVTGPSPAAERPMLHTDRTGPRATLDR